MVAIEVCGHSILISHIVGDKVVRFIMISNSAID